MGSLKVSGNNNKGRSWHRRLFWVTAGGGLLLCGGLALALHNGSSGHFPSVTLSFVGFTNQSVAIGPKTTGSPQSFILLPVALLLAKNTGSVPVELWASISQDNLSMNAGVITGFKDGFWPLDGAGLPHTLKPGESMQLTARVRNDGVPWSTEVRYQRRRLADRFWALLWNSRVPPLRALSHRLGSSAFQLVSVKLGPLTNQPPLNKVLAPTQSVQFKGPPRMLGSPLPPPHAVKPGYSLDLLDTNYQPDMVPGKP